MRDEIDRDLSHVEASLRSNHSGGGQAVRQSLGTQLGRLRERISSLVHSTPPVAQTSSTTDNQQLQERLERASMAHRTRVPLHVLQQQQQDSEEQRQRMREKSNSQKEPSSPTGSQVSTVDARDTPSSASRRYSTLLASRARAEHLQQDEDMELDCVLSCTLREDDDDKDEIGHDMDISQNDEDDNDDMSLQDSGDDIHPIHEIPFLLNDKSRERLGRTLEGSSLSRASSASLENAPQMSTVSNSLVYSWGTMAAQHQQEEPTLLHEDLKAHSLNNALVASDSRVSKYTIADISCGPLTAAIVTASGELLVCGRNEAGQVDPSRDDSIIARPSLMDSLSMQTRVVQVSCGRQHTAALTHSGTVLTWGSNECGQLGHQPPLVQIASGPSTMTRRPPAAMVLPGRRVAAVACGHFFTMVLTTRMSVLVCGAQEISPVGSSGLATTLPALEGLPVAYIAAGAHHAVVVTCHGTAYAWGDNSTGCCGRDHPKSMNVPMPIQMPTSKKQIPFPAKSPFRNWACWDGPNEPVSLSDDVRVVDVACGLGMTALITRSGRLLVCGTNPGGQLGVCSNGASIVHVQSIDHEMGGRFVKVASGDAHLLLLDADGDVWQTGKTLQPERVIKNENIVNICAGGNQNIAIARGVMSTMPSMKCQTSIESDTADGIMLANSVEALLEKISDENHLQQLVRRTEELFRYPAVMNSLFLDPIECDLLYEQLLSLENKDVQQSIVVAIEKGMAHGLNQLRSGDARLIFPEAVRCLLLYLQCPLFRTWKTNKLRFDYRGDLILSLCESFLGLSFEGYRAVMSWATSLFGRADFKRLLLNPLLAQLERAFVDGAGARARPIPVIVLLLKWFYKASERNKGPARPEDFHSDAIDSMNPQALYDDLVQFKKASKQHKASTFFICANSFLMSPSCKRNLLNLENQVDMMRAAASEITWDATHRQFVFDPYFVLAIDRQYLLQQTLQKVSSASPRDLRKSLKVVFKGEDGVDAGGVTKEFFQLLTEQLFDVNTGMWSTQVEDHITWFNSDCTWNDDGYFLVGVLFGLALYNGVLIDVHFPTAIYRKLLGQPLGLEDMVDESTKSGLQHLLDYDDDDVEDVFCLNFEVTWTSLGVERKVELKPGGSNIPVTRSNKEEYVVLYVKWLLVDSIDHQYNAFQRGVMQVLDSSSLDLLRPEELELLVVGSPELDFSALQSNAEYEGGYDTESDVIKNLWRFVENSSHETQLQLLRFCTGSAKAPIGGLAQLPFKIQRAGPDSMQLPTSHTCFNTLLLPDYGSDYDKLAKLLGRAILECEGFGLQ